jgi:polysaccharide biosynthesis PFTS motif protein
MKEYIFDEVVYQNFDLNLIEKLITTQSNFAYQPLIFEYEKMTTKRLMLWYSSNSIPLDYKKENLRRFETNPSVYNNMKIDVHWVWTEKHKSYLSHFTRADIVVKKSLMFYNQEREKTLNDTFDIVIFDVTPKKDINISNFSIYTTDEMIKFITEILKCVESIKAQFKLEVRVALKHKREFSKHTPAEYSQFVRSRIKNKEISVVNSNQNLYGLIQSSKLIIGFPFTSPVIIGQEIKKPSIFYCSSSLLKRASRSENDLFLQSEKSLYAYMKKALVN